MEKIEVVAGDVPAERRENATEAPWLRVERTLDPSLVVAVGIAASALVSELLLAWYFKGWAEEELAQGRKALAEGIAATVRDVRSDIQGQASDLKATLAEVPKALAGIGTTIVEGLAPVVADSLLSRGAATMADKSNAAQAMMKEGLKDIDVSSLLENPDIAKLTSQLTGGKVGGNPGIAMLKRVVPKQYHGLLAGLELKSAMGQSSGGGGTNGSKGWWEYR